jgi:hypothetical protein
MRGIRKAVFAMLSVMFVGATVWVSTPAFSQGPVFDKWVDASLECPADCDPDEYDCPCAVEIE